MKNPETIIHKNLGGLWFEYVYTNGARKGLDYECATMNFLLANNNETTATEFEVLHHGINKTSNDSTFGYRRLTCGQENSTEALNCKIMNKHTNSFIHRFTVDKPSTF